jgi:hypothetical protein
MSKREHYRQKAECLAMLLYLGIKDSDFSETDDLLKRIELAINLMRKEPNL